MMTMELKAHGYQATLAKTGEAGLGKAETFRPDIVLCDLRLPGMDGVAVVRALREKDAVRSAFMVALSADRLDAETERLTAAGFDAAVTEPLEPKALDRLVSEHRPSLRP
jgi:CheY-like chemotaxis protein